MKTVIVSVLAFLVASAVIALEYAVPTEKGAAIVSGYSAEMKASSSYGYPVSPAIKALPEKYRIVDGHSVREKTQAEKNAIDAIMVTNIVVKTSVTEGGTPVVEAEAIYVGIYTALYRDQGYTNAEWNIVAAQVASVAVTNTEVAARTDLLQSSFEIIEAWWATARAQLGLQPQGFHPYPWGQGSVTNVVQKYP